MIGCKQPLKGEECIWYRNGKIAEEYSSTYPWNGPAYCGIRQCDFKNTPIEGDPSDFIVHRRCAYKEGHSW